MVGLTTWSLGMSSIVLTSQPVSWQDLLTIPVKEGLDPPGCPCYSNPESHLLCTYSETSVSCTLLHVILTDLRNEM